MDRDTRTQLNEHRVIEARRALASDIEMLINKLNPVEAVRDVQRRSTGAVKEAIGMAPVTHDTGPVPLVRGVLGLLAVGYGLRQLAGSGMPQRVAGQIEPHLPINHSGHSHATYGGNGNGGGFASGVGDKVGSVKDEASSKLSDVSGRVDDVRGQVTERVGEVREQVAGTAGHLVEEVQFNAMRVQEAVPGRADLVRMAKSNPLLLGCGALFVGAVAGALIPRTELEEEAASQAQSMVMERGQELADAATTALKSGVQSGVDSVKETMTEEIGGGEGDDDEGEGGSDSSDDAGVVQRNRITATRSTTPLPDIH
jgi:uncharacterized protein YjbJ (UPF0337 family)